MTDPIYTCPDHGPFLATGAGCPTCTSAGECLLSGERRRRLSKFCSGALRHFPDDVGLELDTRGWTEYDALVSAVERTYGWAAADHVAAVITTDPKGRFERTSDDTGERVRAAYGHSVDVSLEAGDGPVPDELYHGTAPRNLESIRETGLEPMGRQHVHLSGTRETAITVGQRHASDPVVLVVDAAAMTEEGYRITKRGRETYTVEAVPPRYLSGL